MKIRILPLILALSSVAHAQTAPNSVTPIAPTTAPATAPFFSDVPRDHWAYAAVQRLANAGILEGVGAAPTPTKVVSAPAPRAANLGAAVNLAARTKTALSANPAFKGALINVDVLSQKKQLVLRGTAKSEVQKQLATVIARKNAPGTAISNLLHVVR